MSSKFPNFFLAGVSKSGTTSMANYMSTHPNVFMSVPKEPQYFNFDMPHLQHMKSERAYRALFANVQPEHQIIGDASATYLYSDVAIPNILEKAPQAKFLIMIRNPVELVHSFHQELLYSVRETEEDFETAWNLQDSRKRGENLPRSTEPRLLQYREFVNFKHQLERLSNWVPPEQRKVVLFDDLKTDAAGLYADVLEFLELDHDGRTEFGADNPSKKLRSPLVGKMFNTVQRSPLRPAVASVKAKLGIKKIPGWSHMRDMNVKPKDRTQLDPKFQARLCEELAPQVEYLSGVFNRDLSHWVKASTDA